MLVFSSVSYAEECEVDRTLDVLRNNLFLFLNQGSNSYLTLDQVKDLLTFYVSIVGDPITVECSGDGSISSTPILEIVTIGEGAPDNIPSCSGGLKYGKCSSTKPEYCYAGQIINNCNDCGCQSGYDCISGDCQFVSSNITCFSDLDCPSDSFTGTYYCSNETVKRDHVDYTCNNPGTVSSSCTSSTSSVTLDDCSVSVNETCVDGLSSCQILAADTAPPTVSITAPTSGSSVSGTAVTVTADASDDVGVVGVQFKLDGASLGTEDLSSPFSITWDTLTTADGPYTLTAVARDIAGNSKTSSAVNVTVSNPVNQPPIAVIVAVPDTGIAPLLVNFSGSLSNDSDGSITAYNWDFGDSTTSSGPVVTHNYTIVGSYNVNLTVTDNGGSIDSALQVIDVT